MNITLDSWRFGRFVIVLFRTLIATIDTNEYHAGFVEIREIREIRDQIFRTLIATIGTKEHHNGFVEIRVIRDQIFRTLIATIDTNEYHAVLNTDWHRVYSNVFKRARR